MQFPKWVTKARGQKNQASARLRYIIARLAVELGPQATLQSICDAIGYDHSTLVGYIQKGEFSQKMATHMEKRLGSDRIRAEWLTNPLAIDAK